MDVLNESIQFSMLHSVLGLLGGVCLAMCLIGSCDACGLLGVCLIQPTASAIQPLAFEDSQHRYSVRSHTNKEEEGTAQTKNNSKILAPWGDFEDLLPRRRRRSSTIFSPSRPGQVATAGY